MYNYNNSPEFNTQYLQSYKDIEDFCLVNLGVITGSDVNMTSEFTMMTYIFIGVSSGLLLIIAFSVMAMFHNHRHRKTGNT